MEPSGNLENPMWQGWDGTFMFFNKHQMSRGRERETKLQINQNIV
jgi:hypothetical protein